MKIYPLFILATMLTFMGSAQAVEQIDEAKLGLSKTSVFNDPAPELFEYNDTKARHSKTMPRAFSGAPPQIPHEVESMLPITIDDNQCLECHDRPEKIGQEKVKGGSPMEKSHYSKLGEMNTTDGWQLSGARFNCNQCHVPQAEVDPIMANTF